MNEELLKKYEFGDIWRYHKMEENRKALSLLENRLQEVAMIDNTYSRFETLFYGLLSANIFDSGMYYLSLSFNYKYMGTQSCNHMTIIKTKYLH